jgi:hypothetical protein
MARLTRRSPALDKAAMRLSGMRSLRGQPEFGYGLSLSEYETRVQTLRVKLAGYNELLATLDEKAEEITELERELNTYSEKMLMSVAAHYGKTSLQYVQAGGKIRKSGKRSPAKAKPMTTVVAPSEEKAKTNGKGVKVSMN